MPSIGPRPMNAPYCVKDFTTPLRTSPITSSSKNFSTSAFRASLSTERIEPTALRRFLLTSIILNLTSLFFKLSSDSSLEAVASDAGINTLMPLVAAKTPPFTTSTTLPERMVLFSFASIILSKPAAASTRFFDSIIVPSWSFVRIIKRSISSPILTMSSGFAFGSLESSETGINPACLRPTST